MSAVLTFQPELKFMILDYYSTLFKKNTPVQTTATPAEMEFEKEFDPSELISYSGRLKKDTYEEHLSAAEIRGLKLIPDDYQLYLRVSEKSLVEADQGEGYKVDSLTHSFPFFTPETKSVLEELGKAYESLAGEGNFFTVTSATRTEKQQQALKRRNRNATDGNSSHSFGVSFDISYIRFNGVRGWDAKAQKNLETVLNHFQQTGKIYVIKERRQSCYHVTVR